MPEQMLVPSFYTGVSGLREQVELRPSAGVSTVRGTVRSLRPSDKFGVPVVFGSLVDEDGETTIEFECPAHAAPNEVGEVVLLIGTIKVKPAKRPNCFELQLVGGRIGYYSPGEALTPSIVEPRTTRPKVPLGRFVVDGTPKRLLFLGTERALLDAESTFRTKCKDRFYSLAMLGKDLHHLVSKAAEGNDAVCLVRGGGEAKSFRVWNHPALIVALLALGKPFYTALGHATDFTLADKFADESFVTPSAIGAAYADALLSRGRHEEMEARLEEALSARRTVEEELAKHSKEWAIGEALAAQNRKTSMRLNLILLGFLLLMGLGIFAHNSGVTGLLCSE